MAQTKIEWASATWNPITGCTPISEGCDHCYARRMAQRLKGRSGYPEDHPFRPGVYHKNRMALDNLPIGKRVFVCSMGDLFHYDVYDRNIDEVFHVVFLTRQVDFIFLTKRPKNMLAYIRHMQIEALFRNTYQNAWMGTTCENQVRADERIPTLLEIPSVIRWVSCEPLLGPIKLEIPWPNDPIIPFDRRNALHEIGDPEVFKPKYCRSKINWVVIGPETGPGRRECDPEWIRDLVRQCEAAGVPYFVKAFPMPDGRISKNMTEWPEWAQVRQYPG